LFGTIDAILFNQRRRKMSESQLMTTDQTELVVEPEAEVTGASGVTVTRFNDEVSTDSSAPSEAETADPENPKPVSGFAEALEDAEFVDSDIEPSEEDDGRYMLEVIIGPDNRKRVINPSPWPWRVHGHLEMKFPNGKRYIGSGTMVSKHHVLTAGHCVYSGKDGGWATSIAFQAARNDGNLPFGSVYATRLLSVTGWTNNNDTKYDMGMLILSSNLGNSTGWKGIITGPNNILNRHRVNVSGYPGDKGGRQMWTMADIIKSVQAERIFYDIDTMGGQSGSGVWSIWSGPKVKKCVQYIQPDPLLAMELHESVAPSLTELLIGSQDINVLST
jgi:glutamyl endopeptidase